MDTIKIENLQVFARHGLFPEENALGQKFVLTAELCLDLRAAGVSDNLALSADYGEICVFMKEFMERNTFKLIESAAEQLVRAVLRRFDNIRGMKLEIKKPWAPIQLHLDTVSVTMERRRHRVYIALGSNLGDRRAYIDAAAEALGGHEDCRLLKVSGLIETKPYGGVAQGDFLNGCLELETLLPPLELLDLLHEIEDAAKREREIRWGPRTLDLDIIFYDDFVLDLPELQIPHADLHRRDFVLQPLAELAPGFRHPILGKTVSELLEGLENG